MLVLKRGIKQGIVIGSGAGAVRVHVVEFSGKQVRLGIQAPADVAIRRDELVPAQTRQAMAEATNKTRELCVGEGLA